jgi:tetratricopeptide (TPR) repeat protein
VAENSRSSAPQGKGGSGESGALGDRNLGTDFSGPHRVSGGHPVISSRLLREPVGTFTGRAAEVERLSRMLRTATGAVAIISGVQGLAGIGKTELALRLSQETQALFPLQILVEMRGQTEAPMRPEQALERIIRALPGGELRLPTELEPLINVYRSLISGYRVLIIADDVRDANQVRPLLPTPGSALLLTSRGRLLLPGASTVHALELDVLSVSESAGLLRQLCSRLSQSQATELANRAAHIPLALQLLGNVLRDDPTRQFPDFLQQLAVERAHLEAQRAGEGRALEVLASVAIALRNVDPFSRIALSQLALLHASCDKDAAEAIISLPEHSLAPSEVIRRLSRSHLIEQESRTGTLHIHGVVRDFVKQRRELADELPIRNRHAAYFVRVLVEAEERCRRGRDGLVDGLLRFDRARVHIEAAQAWASERAAQDLVAAQRTIDFALLGPLLLLQRLPPRTRLRWFETALSAARKLGDRLSEGRLLGHIGLCHRDLGQTPRALELYEQCLDIARSLGDRSTEGRALSSLGLAYLDSKQPQRAVTCFDSSLLIARELSDRRAEGVALGNLGLCHLDLGQAPQAMAYFERDLQIARELGDQRGEGRALGNLGLANRLSGQAQRAIEYYEQHVKIARIVGDRRGEANSTWNRALALQSLGRRADAIAAAETALRIREEISDPRADKVRAALATWKQSTQPQS